DSQDRPAANEQASAARAYVVAGSARPRRRVVGDCFEGRFLALSCSWCRASTPNGPVISCGSKASGLGLAGDEASAVETVDVGTEIHRMLRSSPGREIHETHAGRVIH